MSSNYTTITGIDTANTIIVDTTGDDSVKALGSNDTVTGSGGKTSLTWPVAMTLLPKPVTTPVAPFTAVLVTTPSIQATASRLLRFTQVLTTTRSTSLEMRFLRQAFLVKPA